jgi:hypothetical protein
MLRLITGLLNVVLALIPLPNDLNLYRGLFVLIVGVYVAFFWKE